MVQIFGLFVRMPSRTKINVRAENIHPQISKVQRATRESERVQ